MAIAMSTVEQSNTLCNDSFANYHPEITMEIATSRTMLVSSSYHLWFIFLPPSHSTSFNNSVM